MKFQYCEEFHPSPLFGCASDRAFNDFMKGATFTMKVSDTYIDFNEKETKDAIKARLLDVGRVSVADNAYKHYWT